MPSRHFRLSTSLCLSSSLFLNRVLEVILIHSFVNLHSRYVSDHDLSKNYECCHAMLCPQPICAVFKSMKKIRQVDIEIVTPTDSPHELIFRFESDSGLLKTHRFGIQDGDSLRATVDTRSANHLETVPKVLCTILEHIIHHAPEMSLSASQSILKLKSYISGDATQAIQMNTEMTIEAREFLSYDVNHRRNSSGEDNDIIVCCKEVFAQHHHRYYHHHYHYHCTIALSS